MSEQKSNGVLFAEALEHFKNGFSAVHQTLKQGAPQGNSCLPSLVLAMEALPGGTNAAAEARNALLGSGAPAKKPGAKARFGSVAPRYPKHSNTPIVETEEELSLEAEEEEQVGRFGGKAKVYEVKKEKAGSPAAKTSQQNTEDEIENDEAGEGTEGHAIGQLSDEELKEEILAVDLDELAESMGMDEAKEIADRFEVAPSRSKLATLKKVHAHLLETESKS